MIRNILNLLPYMNLTLAVLANLFLPNEMYLGQSEITHEGFNSE